MTNKSTSLRQNKKRIFIVFFLFLCVICAGFYWNYKMNYEMIVKFTQLDESDPSFPFGERKIDASPWIKKGYKKIDNYKIYNPNPIPLERNFKLASAVSRSVERSQPKFPELYTFFNKKESFDEFLKKNIKIEYLGSYFNEYSNLSTNDDFLVTFDNYQLMVERKVKNGSTYLFAYDLKKISSSEQDKQ